jgi:hypothetical protein
MQNPPRIWLDYRPIRIGWVMPDRDIAQLATVASWNACLWGGSFNCLIPLHNSDLARRLVTCFAVDVLIPMEADAASAAFVAAFPHLAYRRWRASIFHEHSCDFTDIRHALHRLVSPHGERSISQLVLPAWDAADPLRDLFALTFGTYPPPDNSIADYKRGVVSFGATETPIAPGLGIPPVFLDRIPPLSLTRYALSRRRDRRGWLSPGVVLGSVTSFDDLLLFWNLRAAGAPVSFYDQDHSSRLKQYSDAFLARSHPADLGEPRPINMWINRDLPANDSWKPDLSLDGLSPSLCDGRGDSLWNGMNIEPHQPYFSIAHRDAVPAYAESHGKANASFTLPDRPFRDEDVQASDQKYAVVVDATQYSLSVDSDLTFETPFVPQLNDFYGRNFYDALDEARSQLGRLSKGAVAVLTAVSRQRLQVNAYGVFNWMKAFFALCQIDISRSEAGLRCRRLIAQLGGLQDCRVLKIRGVRALLRKYGVDETFTRSGAIEMIRDVDTATGRVGFDAFKNLFIEFRETEELKPDDVLRYLLGRRVLRVGLEFNCPNCQLPSWMHLDDVKTISACGQCDHLYDVTSQLKDRDWRYRRSGIFGRDDDQLGGVPVALTLQQLSANLHRVLMYSTALAFRSSGAAIEPCEADWVAVVEGAAQMSEAPVQIVFGEAKSEGSLDEQDIRKLRLLADAVPSHIADTFVLFSKTGAYSAEEIHLARTLNTPYRNRVILWSQDELEPYHVYERSESRLGKRTFATSLADMGRLTRQLYFTSPVAGP